jgi:transposase
MCRSSRRPVVSIVGGVDIHRKQLTFDYVEPETGRWERGRIAPADREHLAKWLVRFDGVEDVQFAMEGCTGWRYVAEEMRTAGVVPHLAEPAETATLRGRKRNAGKISVAAGREWCCSAC